MKTCFVVFFAAATILLRDDGVKAFQDEFGPPDLPSVYKVNGEIDDGTEPPELSIELLKDLSATARGGKSRRYGAHDAGAR